MAITSLPPDNYIDCRAIHTRSRSPLTGCLQCSWTIWSYLW